MPSKVTKQYKPKLLITGITLGAFIAAARPMAVPKVTAATNLYDWTKQEDLDRLGGYYSSAARSADGSEIILSVTDGGENGSPEEWQESPLYISSNGGATWQNIAPEIDPDIRNYWTSVDVSNNGQVMVAASEYGYDNSENSGVDGKIFVSQDGGDTWSNITPNLDDDWEEVVVSGNGSRIAAVQQGSGTIWSTDNFGSNWNAITVSEGGVEIWNLESISISDDGATMLVGGENDDAGIGGDEFDPYTNLFISTNSGDAWNDISPDPEDEIFTISHDLSADGNKIIATTAGWAGGNNDSVFMSENDGADWTEISPESEVSTNNQWDGVTVSDDGSTIAIADTNNDGKMYVSNNDGTNWNEEEPGQDYEDTNTWWRTVDMNADGTKLIVASEENAYTAGAYDVNNSTVTLNDAVGSKKIVITTPEGTTITCSSAVKESGLDVKDTAYQYPLGLVDFCFSGAETANEISIIFVTDLKPNEVAVRKYNPDNQSYATITEANVSQTTYEGSAALLVTYTIVDNGPLDTDPDTGEVADPVGLGTLEVSPPDTGKQKHWLLSVK